MARRYRSAIRVAAALAITAAALAGVALYALNYRTGAGPVAADLPPIMPTAGAPAATADPPVRIPDGFLPSEAVAKRPLSQPEIHWVRSDEVNLPPLVSPCGGFLPSDAERVGGRQMALVGPQGWKLERLVVYRDADSARRAMAERRAALTDCARHDEAGGVSMIWTWQRLSIGDEAIFAGGQRYRGTTALPGHNRAILMRLGRTVVIYNDFGQATVPPRLAEMAPYGRQAKAMATKLAAAPWS